MWFPLSDFGTGFVNQQYSAWFESDHTLYIDKQSAMFLFVSQIYIIFLIGLLVTMWK